MFSHIIELTAKPGQAIVVAAVIRVQAIPEVIGKAEGFVDEIVLISKSDPDHITAISFWNSKEDGDHFFKNGFAAVSAMTAPFLSAPPQAREFSVEASTNERIHP